jgi:Vacuolar (H+)-ATPase G subunit
MASQQGIQQLLQAEQRAQETIAKARKGNFLQ